MKLKKLLLAVLFTLSMSTGLAIAEDKINLNTATKVELVSLNGIGDATADAIIAYREQNGPFLSPADLVKVKGVGIKKAKKLAEFVTTSDSAQN